MSAENAERNGKWGGGISLPNRLGDPGSVVSSPSGDRGGAQAANAFLAYLRPTEHFCYWIGLLQSVLGAVLGLSYY